MSTSVSWQDDLTHSRDLSMREVERYGFFVRWFDSWRVQKGLPLERASAVRFWKEVVLSKTREAWQMEAWAEAMPDPEIAEIKFLFRPQKFNFPCPTPKDR